MGTPISAPRAGLWTTSHEWALTAAGGVAIVAAFAVPALPGDTVDSLVAEDGVVEWLGSIGLFAAAGMFLAAAVTARRIGGAASGLARIGPWVLLGLAALMFAAGGEEISWGQRLFGWATPESISDANAQGETNLHNLTPFEGAAIGDRVFKLFWIALFVALPLLAWLSARRSGRLRERLVRVVPIVPLGLTALFALAWVAAELAPVAFDGSWDGVRPLGNVVTEIWECVVEVLAACAAFVVLRRLLARRPSTPA